MIKYKMCSAYEWTNDLEIAAGKTASYWVKAVGRDLSLRPTVIFLVFFYLFPFIFIFILKIPRYIVKQ